MPNLATFGFSQTMQLRKKLRSLFDDDEPASFEEAAQRVTALLRRDLTDDAGRPACALVRVYKTHLFSALDDSLQAFARQIEPQADSMPGLRCLVLMATQGDEPEWNSRYSSKGHRAIPLSSEAAVAEAPMVSQLIKQLGLSVSAVLSPDPALLLDTRDKAQNVFYVARASGNPYIVAQKEFVERYGIESVIGFGGIMASGDLVAAILFSRIALSPDVADQFKVIGLNFKLAMLPYVRKAIFTSDDA